MNSGPRKPTKPISLANKLRLDALPIPSRAEIALAKEAERQAQLRSIMSTLMPQIARAREKGMSFIQIHRVLNSARADISLADLREAFYELHPKYEMVNTLEGEGEAK